MEKLDIKSLKTPEDIPAGTIMVQHWCNSSTFFKVIGTSKKSVLVVKMPSKQTHFDHEGGGLPIGATSTAIEKNWLWIVVDYKEV